MIKKLSFASLFIFTYLAAVMPVWAGPGQIVKPCPESAKWKALCTYNLDSVQSVVKVGVTILFIVATITALFFLIFGGIRWITSGGDKARLEGARNTIIAAVIGLILTFLSYFILNLVLEILGLKSLGGTSSFNIPTL